MTAVFWGDYFLPSFSRNHYKVQQKTVVWRECYFLPISDRIRSYYKDRSVHPYTADPEYGGYCVKRFLNYCLSAELLCSGPVSQYSLPAKDAAQ